MMARFFVEFRFYGHPKLYMKALTYEVARAFRVRGAITTRPVPHMTLYGPSETRDIRRVFAAIENAAQKSTIVPFGIDGFVSHNAPEGKVIACRINASSQLERLRSALAEELAKVSVPGRWDAQSGYWFHSTIAYKDIDQRFEDIWSYITAKQRPRFEQHLVRITVLGEGRKILREYDLVLKRWLSRSQVLFDNWYWRRRTEESLRKLQGLPSKPRRSMWRAIGGLWGRLSRRNRVYVIADTHFDHENVIKYCSRQFSNAHEMNDFIMTSWNHMVRPKDTVYHLGDWSYGRGSRPASYWRHRLHGRILSVRGDHDRQNPGMRFRRYRVLRSGSVAFLLVHDPDWKPFDWHGWVIHGHKHNNQMDRYPFINGERKTINVSVELVGYKPVSVESLISLDLDSIRRMRTIDSQPERW